VSISENNHQKFENFLALNREARKLPIIVCIYNKCMREYLRNQTSDKQIVERALQTAGGPQHSLTIWWTLADKRIWDLY